MASDFVKPKLNEVGHINRLDNQVRRMEEQVERDAAVAEDNDADFDREAYDQLKQELSMQKKVKEDMLSGTLPRFKPYLRV